jgi:ABC-type sugar transport system ATPase subunit
MSDYAVEVENVSKHFGAVCALSDVTLSVRKGHIHALVGANGAGKSTLVKILDGVYPTGSYQGRVRVAGSEVVMRSPHDARRQGIAYVPQEIMVIEALSVAENIFVGQVGHGGGWWVSSRELHDRAQRFLRDHHLDLNPRTAAAHLSASQRQLVMIARALAVRPSVLVLDEATACLTEREVTNLFALVRRLRDQGQTCIFISHKLREVEELADRVTVLRDGRVAAEFDRGRFTHEAVVNAMIGRTLDVVCHGKETDKAGEVLRIERLSVPHPHLARRNVVEGVSFSVRAGEILGLAGLVGSGRSEVLNAIYGRLPHRGRIIVNGRPVRMRSPRQAHRAGIGLLTEDRKRDGLLFNLGVRENIGVGSLGRVSRFGVLRRRQETRFAEGFMHRLSIRASSSSAAVTTLSGGNQQKVILSRLLLARPSVLLLDEPTKGVDVAAKAEIYRILAELAGNGIALVVVSSELEELLTLCDRIMVLCRGRMTDLMTRAEAGEARIMRAATGDERVQEG